MAGLVLAIGLALIAVPARPEAADAELLQGEWRVIAADSNTPSVRKFYTGAAVVVRGNRHYQDNVPIDNTFVLDSAKEPKQIDLYSQEAEDPKVPLKGIYAIEKDRLRLYWRGPPAPRPASFDRSHNHPDWDDVWLILERAKR